MSVTEIEKHAWSFQYQLARDYLIPLLRDWGVVFEGLRVLDIGCSEGGVACALAERGAVCFCLDRSARRLQAARILSPARLTAALSFVRGDLFALPLSMTPGKFDLILLRDIFYQLPQKKKVLRKMTQLMGSGTLLFISIPSFYSVHRNPDKARANWLRYFPFLHVLPETLWRLLRPFLENWLDDPYAVQKLNKLRKNRISLSQFLKGLKYHGLVVLRERYYLSRPGHRLSYGFPVILTNHIGRIPIVREILITGAFFLITKQEEKSWP